MKALLLNGPRHLTTLDPCPNSPTIVVPMPQASNWPLGEYSPYIAGPHYPVFETVVYHRHPGKVGGFALYVAEDDE